MHLEQLLELERLAETGFRPECLVAKHDRHIQHLHL